MDGKVEGPFRDICVFKCKCVSAREREFVCAYSLWRRLSVCIRSAARLRHWERECVILSSKSSPGVLEGDWQGISDSVCVCVSVCV